MSDNVDNLFNENKSVDIEVTCPICGLRKILNIPESIVANTSHLATIFVPKSLVCIHHFQIFLDKQFKIRGYNKIDFELEAIQLEDDTFNLNTQSLKINKDSLYMVKNNFPSVSIAYVFTSILLKKKCIIVLDYFDIQLNKAIIEFFNNLLDDLFEFKIEIISRNKYNNLEKSKYKNSIIVDELKTKGKPKLDSKKIKMENSLIAEFFENDNIIEGFIILKKRIKDFYQNVLSIIQEFRDKKEKYNIMEIKDFLEMKHLRNFELYELNFLLDIVKSYFGVKLKYSYSDIVDFI